MSRNNAIIFAVIGVALLIWFALSQSWVPAALLGVLVLVMAFTFIRVGTGPGTVGRRQDKDEARVRKGFPRPPEQRGQ